MQPVRLANGAFLIRDDFKSHLETMEAALNLFAKVPTKRRMVVIGDVTEPKGSYGQILQHLGERIGKISSMAFFICKKNNSGFMLQAQYVADLHGPQFFGSEQVCFR